MIIENIIIGNLLMNREFIRYLPYIKNEYFSDLSHKNIHKFIIGYVKKYKKIPNKSAMAVMLDKSKLTEAIYDSICKTLQEIYDTYEPSDFEWLITESENWAKERAYHNALTECVYLKEKGDDVMKSIDIMKKGLGVSFKADLGIDYNNNIENQYNYYNQPNNVKVPFNINALNFMTNGGVERNSLNIVQAGINVGKTTFLLNVGKGYTESGLNVVYFTHEIDENKCALRLDVLNTGESFVDIVRMSKNKYFKKMNEIMSKLRGKLFIKRMSSSSTPQNHRYYLEELENRHGIKTDCYIFDYLGITSTSRLSDNKRSDSNTYYKNVAEEARDLAMERNMIGWSAVQFNRTGQETTDVNLTHCADSIAIQNTVDMTLAITQPEHMKSTNQCSSKLLKSRYSNKDEKGVILLGLDNSKQLFSDTENWDENLNEDNKKLMTKISSNNSYDKDKLKNINFGG